MRMSFNELARERVEAWQRRLIEASGEADPLTWA
jgi:hypothetical protein